MSESLASKIPLAPFLGALLFLAGCRSEHASVSQTITGGDVVGSWRYAEVGDTDGGNQWIVTIQFARDGTFLQTLVPPSTRNLIQQAGAWRIEGGTLKMESLIVWDEAAAGHWAPRGQDWGMIASAKRPGTLALRGGLAADHSLDREMARISDDECRLLTGLPPAGSR